MKNLSALIIGLVFLLGFLSPKSVSAVTIASQTQGYSNELDGWQVIQELGDNLSGTLTTFTFRVSSAVTNINQFQFTAQNTRIYDKTTNTLVATGCIPTGADPHDTLRGLTFNTSGVPPGFEDVTVDFSCNNFNFISGHRYLIKVTNSNRCTGCVKFVGAFYSGGPSTDLFTGGGVRYSSNANLDPVCDPIGYVWDSQSTSHGCLIWTTPQDDIYFVLNNSTQPLPAVIFIPGIGGSELQTSGAINWSASDGHGGTFTHSYPSGDKVWVNQTQAILPGFDDYFDILRLNSDGITPAASLSLTGNLNSFGYSDIDTFFQGIGYQKGSNYFVFNYDWRKDISSTKSDLDTLVNQAKSSSGQSKVILVAHSLGGLVARNYISDSTKASKISKLIELGVPHLGAPWAMKAELNGVSLSYKLRYFNIPIIPGSEINDIVQNYPAAFELLPFNTYYSFYNNSDSNHPYPFRDERDIDNNGVTGSLTYSQTKTLLQNQGVNQTVFNAAELFHNTLDPSLSATNGVTLYEIVGSSQPTLGQIRETWLVSWPINLISKTEEVFINGDDTVPLFSASLKDGSTNLSGGATIYYVPQTHADLVTGAGTAMQTVKSILLSSTLPSQTQTVKSPLEGLQLSADQNSNIDLYDSSNNHTGLDPSGQVEANIPNTFYDSTGNTTNVFIKKTSTRVTAKVRSSSSTKTNIKIHTYSGDSITNTYYYKDVPTTSGDIQTSLDPTSTSTPTLLVNNQSISPTSSLADSSSLDQTPPITSISLTGTPNPDGSYTSSTTVTLTPADDNSGTLQTEYSLDSGATVQTYTNPFAVSAVGTTTVQYFSTDKFGNQESPHTTTVTITAPAVSTVSSSSSSDTSSSTGGGSVDSAVLDTATTNSSPKLDLSFQEPASAQLANSTNQRTEQPQVLGTSTQTHNTPGKKADIISKLIMGLVGGVGVLGLFMGSTVVGKLPSPKKFRK